MNTVQRTHKNLQLYPKCVSTLPIKRKPHKAAHFKVNVVLYYSTARMGLRACWAVFTARCYALRARLCHTISRLSICPSVC